MIRIIDTYTAIDYLFDSGNFNIEKWKTYIYQIYSNSADIFLSDMNEYIENGRYTYDKDFLPILNAVCDNPKLDILHASFGEVVNHLNEKVIDTFGKELDVDIVLYMGLCNGAGWVTNINGTDTVLLGIEKIIELNWCDEHFLQIKTDFHNDLGTMTRQNQQYFGDWCSYQGKGDVGDYLGARFIQCLIKKHSFDDLITYDFDEVYDLYCEFVENCG